MRFGEYIKRLREAKGLGMGESARELGLTPQRLSDMENGRRNFQRHPPHALLAKMALLYDHPLSSIIENSEFFQYEKVLIAELLAELQPVIEKLDKKTLDMLVEARQYTPEMEVSATEACSLVLALKTAVSAAQSKYSRAPRGATREPANTRRTG